MTRTAFRIVALAALMLAGVGTGWGQDDNLERETLRGIDRVAVVVEPLEPHVEQNGLTTDQIRTDAELKLRLAGVTVPPKVAAGDSFLSINLAIPRRENGLYFFFIGVSLRQPVVLLRNGQGHMAVASTWEIGSSGTVGAAKLQQIRDTVKDLVDRFINDYLAVNPRQP